MPESGVLVPLRNRVGLTSPEGDPGALDSPRGDTGATDDDKMIGPQSLSRSLPLDGDQINLESWTVPRFHKVRVTKPRMYLTEEYPKSLTRSGISGSHSDTVYSAIINGNIECLKELFRSGEVTHVDKRGNTALHVAATHGQVRPLRWLLLHAHIPAMTKNKRGETCGHQAASMGHVKCLKAVLSVNKETPLSLVSERDKRGQTVLHHAVLGGSQKAVEWLVKEFGKDLCLMKNTDGAIALHMAAAKGHRDMVRIFVDCCPKSVNSRDTVGASPIFYAAQGGHLDVLRCMVHGGNGDINTAKSDGTTLLHISALRGHLQILDYLLLKLGNEALLTQSQDGSSLLHFAAGYGSDHVIKHLQQNPKFPEALELVDVNDSTPAHDAADGGHVMSLKILLEAGLELFTPDKDGETPYSLALRCTNPQCVLFVRSQMERDYHSEGDVLSGDEESPPISGVMGIRALSREDSYNFKKAGCQAVTFPSHKKLGRRKMGHVVSTHWPDSDSLSRKSHSEDSDTLSSTDDSKKGRLHRQKQQSKGLFRGEFILMEAQPRDGMSTRERRSIMSTNGYLYAQKNRPRPITLPFQVDECPTRIHQMESSDDLDIDDIDRFNEEKTPLVVIQEYNGFRHGSRSGSLDEIKEEEEDLDSASIMAFRYDMLNSSRLHNGLEGEYLAQRGSPRRRDEDPRSTLESQSSGISVFHNENCHDRLEDSPYGQLGRPKLSLSEESGASGQYDSGCKSSFSSSNSESEDHNKGHRHRDSDGFSSFSPESTSSSFRIMTNKEQMGHFNNSKNTKQMNNDTTRDTKSKPCKSDSLPSSTSSRDSLGESSQENAVFDFGPNAFSAGQMFSCGSSRSPMGPIEQLVKDSFEMNKHSYQNSSGNVQNIVDSSNSRIVQIRTNHGKSASSNSDSHYETGSVTGSDSMYPPASPNVIHLGDPSSNYTTVIILTSDDSYGNTRIEVNPQCGSTEDLSSLSLPPETCDPKDSTSNYQAKMAHYLKTVHFEKDRSSAINESSSSVHHSANGVDSTPGRKPSDIISSSNHDTHSSKSPSPSKPKVPPPPRISRKLDNNSLASQNVSTQSNAAVPPNIRENKICNETRNFTESNSKDVKEPGSNKGSGCRIKELQQVLMKQANPFCTVIPTKKPDPSEISKRPRSTSAPQVTASAAVLELAARKASVVSSESFVASSLSSGETKRPPAPPPPPQTHSKPQAPQPPTSVPSIPPPRPPPPITSPPPRPPPPVLPPSFTHSPPPVPPPPPPPLTYASSTLPLVNRKSESPKPCSNKQSDNKKPSEKSSKQTSSSPVDDDTKVRMADVKNMIQRAGTLPSDRTRNYGSLPDLKHVGKRDKHSKTSKSGEGKREGVSTDEKQNEHKKPRKTAKHRSNTPSERTSVSGSSTRSPKPRHKTKRSGEYRADSLRRGDSPRSHDSPRRPIRHDSLRRRDKQRHDSPKPRNSSRTSSPRPREKSRRDSPKMRDKNKHNSRESKSYDSSVSQQRYDSLKSQEKGCEDSPRPRENKRRDSPRPRESNRRDSPRPRERDRRDSPRPRERDRRDSPRPHERDRCDSPHPRYNNRSDSPRPRVSDRRDSPRPPDNNRPESPRPLDREPRNSPRKQEQCDSPRSHTSQRHDSPRPRETQRRDSPRPRGNQPRDNQRNPQRHDNVRDCHRRRESPQPRNNQRLESPHVREGSRPRSKQRHESPRPRPEKTGARTDSPRHLDRGNEKQGKSGSPKNPRRHHSPNKHRNKHSKDPHADNTREPCNRKTHGAIIERTQRQNAVKAS